MKKHSLSMIGFLQALGIAIYCLLIASFFKSMESMHLPEPGVLAPILMLMLLVFSATICGSLMFGYPVYLLTKGKVKEAWHLLAYTLLYSFSIIIIVMFFVTML